MSIQKGACYLQDSGLFCRAILPLVLTHIQKSSTSVIPPLPPFMHIKPIPTTCLSLYSQHSLCICALLYVICDRQSKECVQFRSASRNFHSFQLNASVWPVPRSLITLNCAVHGMPQNVPLSYSTKPMQRKPAQSVHSQARLQSQLCCPRHRLKRALLERCKMVLRNPSSGQEGQNRAQA